jgi:hypothetical protein
MFGYFGLKEIFHFGDLDHFYIIYLILTFEIEPSHRWDLSTWAEAVIKHLPFGLAGWVGGIPIHHYISVPLQLSVLCWVTHHSMLVCLMRVCRDSGLSSSLFLSGVNSELALPWWLPYTVSAQSHKSISFHSDYGIQLWPCQFWLNPQSAVEIQ